MGHVYEAHGDDGTKYDVETNHHHEDHSPDTFAKHLLDVIKATLSGVLANKIINFRYKGGR